MILSSFDKRICQLGEGPIWHPLTDQLFWFDIHSNKLLSLDAAGAVEWTTPFSCSCAAWVDRVSLLIAHEKGLSCFNFLSGEWTAVADIEAGNSLTRSNDGRADPWGGFWFSTMGKQAEPEAGAIYRYYKGEVRLLINRITIPNSICFSELKPVAYYADSALQMVWSLLLDESTGWPVSAPAVFLNLVGSTAIPDGAVVDRDGNFINAQWGTKNLAIYNAEGKLQEYIDIGVPQVTCPAFGNERTGELFVTSARVGLSPEQIKTFPQSGQTFRLKGNFNIVPEHQVRLN